jgi:hypothetical protein
MQARSVSNSGRSCMPLLLERHHSCDLHIEMYDSGRIGCASPPASSKNCPFLKLCTSLMRLVDAAVISAV